MRSATLLHCPLYHLCIENFINGVNNRPEFANFVAIYRSRDVMSILRTDVNLIDIDIIDIVLEYSLSAKSIESS